jgi:ABC-type Fe3+-citrate transport system substrate-binding protein
VTVGLNEQDAFFALGVAPVGVTDWMGFENGIGPWAQEAAKAAGDPPELLTNTDGIRFEKIAALRPDVIVALYSDLKESDYEKLSQIAPVVASPDGHADFGIPWQETTPSATACTTSLDVHDEGRDFVVLESRPDDAYNAVGAQTVLSMPLALDVLVPALAAAVDGDPATVPLAKD